MNLVEAEQEIARLSAELHRRAAHPDFEYETTQCGRKLGPPPDPIGEGWEPNVDLDGGWGRFEFHENYYWRRLRPSTDDHQGDMTCRTIP